MRKLLIANMLFVLALFTGHSRVQDEETTVAPDGSKFVVHVDITALKANTFGAKLFEIAKAKAVEEIKSDDDRHVLDRAVPQVGRTAA